MTVQQLLSTVSAYELGEWQAYERVHGPVGREYANEALASINDALNLANKLLGCQLSENPVPDPDPYVRPPKVYDEALKAMQESQAKKVDDTQDQGFMTQAEIDAEFESREA